MANWVITKDFITPAQVIAESEDSANGYYAANVLQPQYPFRPWRSVGTSNKRLVIDFGANVTVAAIIENNANHTGVGWEAGTGVSTFPDNLGTFTLPHNPRVDRRIMGLIPVTMATPRRYLRRTPSAIEGGDAFYELGSLLFVTVAGMTPLTKNVGVPTVTQARSVEILGIGAQTNVTGPATFETQLSWDRQVDESQLDQMEAFFGDLIHTPHLLFENTRQDGQGVSRHAYYVQAANVVPYALPFKMIRAALTVREVIA